MEARDSPYGHGVAISGVAEELRQQGPHMAHSNKCQTGLMPPPDERIDTPGKLLLPAVRAKLD
jgi:hypothetical protein